MPGSWNLFRSDGGIELCREVCLLVAEQAIDEDPHAVKQLLLLSKVRIQNPMVFNKLTVVVLLFLAQKLRNLLYQTLVVQRPPAGVYESVPTDNPFVPSSFERQPS